jgi:hypothetical protein
VFFEIVQIISKSKENLSFLLLVDQWMFHCDEMPAELIEQIIAKNEATLFNSPLTLTQILVKRTQLKGFAWKILHQSSTCPSFDTNLVEQLHFTGGREKAFDDLPPSVVDEQ